MTKRGMEVAAACQKIHSEKCDAIEQPGGAGLVAEGLLPLTQGWGLCRVCVQETGEREEGGGRGKQE